MLHGQASNMLAAGSFLSVASCAIVHTTGITLMSAQQVSTATLQAENAALRHEVEELRKRLTQLEGRLGARPSKAPNAGRAVVDSSLRGEAPLHAAEVAFQWESSGHSLTHGDIERYSRQLILPALGVQGQVRLRESSVLVIGAGGLGCPAILYLAAAGIGRLGIVDRDAVELSNIHRQVAHTEASVGCHKSDSATAAAQAINSTIQITVHRDGFMPCNALAMVRQYDIVIDASDNSPTRYLASDACVIAGKPLVSGAALGTDGQLTVYNHGPDGPCYRCLYPVAPRADACTRCSDAGVLGPVPGFIGCLQALEAVKLAADIGTVLARRLLIADALSGRFSTVQLRARSPDCAACGQAPSINADTLAAYDYGAFTGQAADDTAPMQSLLPGNLRVSPQQLAVMLARSTEVTNDAARSTSQPLLLDVRPAEQFAMCRLPGSINVPFDKLRGRIQEVRQLVESSSTGSLRHPQQPLVVLCRRGNDSQVAVQWLAEAGIAAVDLLDGLSGCKRVHNSAFPQY